MRTTLGDMTILGVCQFEDSRTYAGPVIQCPLLYDEEPLNAHGCRECPCALHYCFGDADDLLDGFHECTFPFTRGGPNHHTTRKEQGNAQRKERISDCHELDGSRDGD